MDNINTTTPAVDTTQGKSMADVFWPDNAQTEQGQKYSEPAELFQHPNDPDALQQDETGFIPFALPEDIEIDHEILTAFRPVAADLGLDQDQAQALVDFYAAQVEGLSSRLGSSVMHDHDTYIGESRKEWAAAARKDEEIGGVRHQHAVGVAQNALRQVATPDLVSILAETGLGDHPEIIRLFYRIGTRIGEDPVMSGGRGHASTGLADLFYGSHG